MHVLHLDSSARVARSHSRRLTRYAIDTLQRAQRDDLVVTHRDVGQDPPACVSEAWIAAAFAADADRDAGARVALAESDTLIAEVLAADLLVLGVPLYNYGVPAALKAWIDQVVRVRRTFDVDFADPAHPKIVPLVHGKRALVITTAGEAGFQPGQPLAHMNHRDPHLVTVLAMIGITDVSFVHVEKDEIGGTPLADSIAQAEREIASYVGARAWPSRGALAQAA